MTNIMYLMNYLTPVLKLTGEYMYNINKEGENQGKCLFVFVATKVDVLNETLMPFCLRPYANTEKQLVSEFNMWFQRRIITHKRKNQVNLVDEFMFKNNPKILKSTNIEKVMFASVSDRYWLSKHNIPVTLDEYRKKRKELYLSLTPEKDNFGNLCFTQNPYILKDKNNIKLNNNNISFLNNLNYCLGGITNKRWIYNKEKDNLELVKQRNIVYGQEPINEILATRMLKYLKFPNLPFVEYSFYIDGMELCSKCENFLGEKEEFVPMADIVRVLKRPSNTNMYKHVIECLKFLEIENAESYIDEMIIFDRCALNFDRHLGNFGAIRDTETGAFTRMAPLFDLGSCYFANYNDEIKLKDSKEEKKALLFIERIKELESQGQIPYMSNELLEILKTELNNYIYTTAEMDKRILEKIIEINEIAERNESKEYSEEILEEVSEDISLSN